MPDLVSIEPPPMGVSSNFEDPENHSYIILAVAGVCIPLILIIGAIRWYVRRYILKIRAIDDCEKVPSQAKAH